MSLEPFVDWVLASLSENATPVEEHENRVADEAGREHDDWDEKRTERRVRPLDDHVTTPHRAPGAVDLFRYGPRSEVAGAVQCGRRCRSVHACDRPPNAGCLDTTRVRNGTDKPFPGSR